MLWRELDEYTEDELRWELKRRAACAKEGRCSYCGRECRDTPCKFPERHEGRQVEQPHWSQFVRELPPVPKIQTGGAMGGGLKFVDNDGEVLEVKSSDGGLDFRAGSASKVRLDSNAVMALLLNLQRWQRKHNLQMPTKVEGDL